MESQFFPQPSIPLSPILGKAINETLAEKHQFSILDAKYKCFITSGRSAIALALEQIGVTQNDEVLIPAYHCEAMVAPIKWIGAKPVFFKIEEDTTINLLDVEEKITSNTKAIIVTHYFGFTQSLLKIKEICGLHKISIIEDCAHAFFGVCDNQAVGTNGDYAIASCMKFFPVYDGGCLSSNSKNINDIQLTPPSMIFQVKALINILEKSVAYKRLGIFGHLLSSCLTATTWLWSRLKKIKGNEQVNIGPSSSEGGYELDVNWINKTISLPSKFIIRTANLSEVVYLRRQNYLKLHARLATLPGCNPLYKQLPDHVVPWVYPLYVDQPEKYFSKLKMEGVPMWRFGEYLDAEVTEEICPVSINYSRHIFQFPCHQSLKNQEIEWMIEKITQIID